MKGLLLLRGGGSSRSFVKVNRRRSYASSLSHTRKRGATAVAEPASHVDWKTPLPDREGGETRPNVIALGKFDALHIGHRALAVQAAAGGGQAWLTTFSGIAEVLGWPSRLPLVAPPDRPRVLLSWAPMCCGIAPRTLEIPFPAVRSMSPADFVRLLALDLKVSGVVVGRGYRFGYKAQGDTQLLTELGQAYGLDVQVVQLISLPNGQQVSSSLVREQLAAGHMAPICDLLGRRYRVVGLAQRKGDSNLWIPRENYYSLPPGEQRYEAVVTLGSPLEVLEQRLEGYATHVDVTRDGMHVPLPVSPSLPWIGPQQLINVDFICGTC